jgi:aryl-alcohol dehydrogenase-like predicted oxidoreductase
MSEALTRRSLVTGVLGAAGLAACSSEQIPPEGTPKEGQVQVEPPAVTRSEMPRRKLGKTGVEISLVGLGGFHVGQQKDPEESIRIIRSAVDRGITFLDNCWDYNEGQSEERMGRALEGGLRQKVFLMSKIDGRTREAAAAQIDQSLKRLRTDVIDLMQIHEIIRPEDPERCFAEDACVAALLDAKKAGKIRFIGFTGHKDPDHHLAMLKRADQAGFAFDAVQMPLNVMDAHFRSFERKVLPLLVERGIAVLGMKPLGAGKIVKEGKVDATECLHYAMNLPTSVVITGIDSMGVLEQAVAAATSFRPLPPERVSALLARTAEAAKDGALEKFKTSSEHDGTAKNPHWLETARI